MNFFPLPLHLLDNVAAAVVFRLYQRRWAAAQRLELERNHRKGRVIDVGPSSDAQELIRHQRYVRRKATYLLTAAVHAPTAMLALRCALEAAELSIMSTRLQILEVHTTSGMGLAVPQVSVVDPPSALPRDAASDLRSILTFLLACEEAGIAALELSFAAGQQKTSEKALAKISQLLARADKAELFRESPELRQALKSYERKLFRATWVLAAPSLLVAPKLVSGLFAARLLAYEQPHPSTKAEATWQLRTLADPIFGRMQRVCFQDADAAAGGQTCDPAQRSGLGWIVAAGHALQAGDTSLAVVCAQKALSSGELVRTLALYGVATDPPGIGSSEQLTMWAIDLLGRVAKDPEVWDRLAREDALGVMGTALVTAPAKYPAMRSAWQHYQQAHNNALRQFTRGGRQL